MTDQELKELFIKQDRKLKVDDRGYEYVTFYARSMRLNVISYEKYDIALYKRVMGLTEKGERKMKVGDTIRINYMGGEPSYSGRTGEITYIDDMGQLHGTWGGLAVIPEEDSFTVLEEDK